MPTTEQMDKVWANEIAMGFRIDDYSVQGAGGNGRININNFAPLEKIKVPKDKRSVATKSNRSKQKLSTKK